MKYLITLIFFLGTFHWGYSSQCTTGIPPLITKLKWWDMEEACYASISGHIQHELTASVTYLTMSAYFAREIHFRPGLSKFFLASANEERQHAKSLIDYLLMRGGEVPSDAIKDIVPLKTEWKSVSVALEDALNLERNVTEKIKEMIKVCEGVGDPSRKNDYHAVDHFTGEFLEEQHKSLRELAGYLSTLERMRVQYGDLAEIIFDKSL